MRERLRKFFADRVLGVHDTTHRIALGVAVGVGLALTPTIGFQMVLIVAVSALLRANKVVGVPFAWISNPATLWIYVPNYILGSWMLGRPWNTGKMLHTLGMAFSVTGGWRERLDGITTALKDYLLPLWVGSIVVALVGGAISYGIIYYAVREFRRRYKLKHGKPHPGDEAEAAAVSRIDH